MGGRRILFLFIFICLFPAVTLAAQSFTIPCSSGEITGTLDYSPTTGDFTLNFTFNSCTFEDIGTLNGSGTTTGNYTPTSATEANLRVDMTASVTFTAPDGSLNVSGTCERHMDGVLNLSTQSFTGSYSQGCSGSGTLPFDVMTMLLMPTD